MYTLSPMAIKLLVLKLCIFIPDHGFDKKKIVLKTAYINPR